MRSVELEKKFLSHDKTFGQASWFSRSKEHHLFFVFCHHGTLVQVLAHSRDAAIIASACLS